MRYTIEKFEVKAGQPVKLVFTNPDATPHNLAIVEPGTVEEIGMAANELAKDPKEMVKGQFIPVTKKSKILHHTKMLQPDTVQVLRFKRRKSRGCILTCVPSRDIGSS